MRAATAIISVFLSLAACAADGTMNEVEWIGDPAPNGVYTPLTTFTETCQDGSDRSRFLTDFDFRMEVRPDTMSAKAWTTIDIRVKRPDGRYVETEAWGEINVREDGSFDTSNYVPRAATLEGRFERRQEETRVVGQLNILHVEPDYVECNRLYEFTLP